MFKPLMNIIRRKYFINHSNKIRDNTNNSNNVNQRKSIQRKGNVQFYKKLEPKGKRNKIR